MRTFHVNQTNANGTTQRTCSFSGLKHYFIYTLKEIVYWLVSFEKKNNKSAIFGPGDS